jgi:hypothetical protein
MGIRATRREGANRRNTTHRLEATSRTISPIASEERGIAAPSPSSSPYPSPLSLAIDPTCTLDLSTIGGMVRLFYIDLKNSFTLFMIVDLITCEYSSRVEG